MPADEETSAQPPDKELSNSASTGAAGPHFEVQVVSAFAVLMLAGGVAPCIECVPIRRIKLQERKSGYRIDDFVVHATDSNDARDRKLLVQVKRGISFTKSDKDFGETVAAAWRDFNDPSIFTRGKDAIAIVTGPLSASDIEGMRTILDWARTQELPQEYFQNVKLANFSSNNKREKLRVIRAHINAAAASPPIDDEVFQFLRHLHVLSFDLDMISGVSHMFLRTIINCFSSGNASGVWERIYYVVSDFNPNAGVLTASSFPRDIRDAFKPRVLEAMPASLASTIPPKEVLE